jgi:hypothetical protein
MTLLKNLPAGWDTPVSYSGRSARPRQIYPRSQLIRHKSTYPGNKMKINRQKRALNTPNDGELQNCNFFSGYGLQDP